MHKTKKILHSKNKNKKKIHQPNKQIKRKWLLWKEGKCKPMNNGLIPRIHKELTQFNSKKQKKGFPLWHSGNESS